MTRIRSPYVKGDTPEYRLKLIAVEANPRVIQILDEHQVQRGDTLVLTAALLDFLIPFVLDLISKPVPTVVSDPYRDLTPPPLTELRTTLQRRLDEAQMENRFVAITADTAAALLQVLDRVHHPKPNRPHGRSSYDAEQMLDSARRLVKCLEDPQPGLASWHMMVGRLLNELPDGGA